ALAKRGASGFLVGRGQPRTPGAPSGTSRPGPSGHQFSSDAGSEFAAKCSQPAPALRSSRHIRCLLPHPVALFSVSCAGLAVQGFALGEAAVLHFGGFAGHRDWIGGALQTAGIPIGFPSQKWFFSLLTTRHRPQSPRATHYKPGIPQKGKRPNMTKHKMMM